MSTPSNFLSPSAAVRPLRAWSTAQCAHIGQLFDGVLAEWLRAWSIGQEDIAAALVQVPSNDADESGHSWTCLTFTSARTPEKTALQPIQCWWTFAIEENPSSRKTYPQTSIRKDLTEQAMAATHTVLFADVVTAPSTLAAELTQAAWQDWWQRIATFLAGANASFETAATPGPMPEHRPWSGDLQIRLPWGQGYLYLALEGALLAHLLRDPISQSSSGVKGSPIKVNVLQALGAHLVPLYAELAEVELSLGQLQDLAVGDVVRLAHPLDAPLQIKTQTGQPLCAAWLGQHQGHLAVELALASHAHDLHLSSKGS